MNKVIIFAIIFISFILVQPASAQEPIGIILKTNLLNLVAKGPSFSIEKTFVQKYGLEFSYSAGELNWGRDYNYKGYLLRGKMYAYKIKSREVTPFFGVYVGTLNKTIISNAEVHPTGFFSIGRNRNFETNSLRSGLNLGLSYQPFKRLVLEATTGIGYGKYFNMKNYLSQPPPKGYLDFQLWLSVGYNF